MNSLFVVEGCCVEEWGLLCLDFPESLVWTMERNFSQVRAEVSLESPDRERTLV
jgi:hypothetical protein